MASMVTTTKCKGEQGSVQKAVAKERVENVIIILSKLDSADGIPQNFGHTDIHLAREFKQILEAAYRRREAKLPDSILSSYISLREAIMALEDSTMDQSVLYRAQDTVSEPRSGSFLAHTTLARKFHRCRNIKRPYGPLDGHHQQARENRNLPDNKPQDNNPFKWP